MELLYQLLVLILGIRRVFCDDLIGWRMVDRFMGFRYEVSGLVQDIGFEEAARDKADELACFGWIQESELGTMVGEARCAKPVGSLFKEWLRNGPSQAKVDHVEIKDYEDTKIKLHFSYFKILTSDRMTCFREPGPHQCLEFRQATSFSSPEDSRPKVEDSRRADEL